MGQKVITILSPAIWKYVLNVLVSDDCMFLTENVAFLILYSRFAYFFLVQLC